MKKANLAITSLALSLVLTACGSGADSELNATNKFKGVTVTHWYETFNFIPGDAKNFADYYKNNAEALLGQRFDFLPETLQGLWYMDGNPLADKTFSLSDVEAIHSSTGDIRWAVGSPTMYSWFNTAEAHGTISALLLAHLEYELKWQDCPYDVKKEREALGVENGGCKASDRQFAVVTPFAKVGALRIRVPQSLAYFDLYLRPKTSDHLVWERRSKMFGTIGGLATLFTQGLKSGGFHRYKFTQIIDGNGTKLSSFSKFESDVAAAAKKMRRPLNDFLFLTCNEGSEGCDLKHSQTMENASEADILNLAKLPYF